MDNGVPIYLSQSIVLGKKHRTLLNVRVNVSALSMLSPPINDRSTREDLERPLQKYSKVVAICSEHLKSQFCVFYNREYTLDSLKFARPRKRTVDLKQVLLKNYARIESGEVWSQSRTYRAIIEDLWQLILKRVVLSNFIEKARGLFDLFNCVVKSLYLQPITHNSNWTPDGD